MEYIIIISLSIGFLGFSLLCIVDMIKGDGPIDSTVVWKSK